MNALKNILVITYWGFNSPILNSYALPYIKIIKEKIPPGSIIYLFTLTPRKKNIWLEYSSVKENLAKENIILINFNYHNFGLIMTIKFIYIFLTLIYLILKNNIKFIHGWCTPGGAIGYFLSVFTKRPLVLDSFEPHAESMVETKTWSSNSLSYRILFKLEELQLKKATHVICAASGMIEYSQKVYNIKKENYYVKPACVNLDLFREQKTNREVIPQITHDSIVCVYVGKFGDIYLAQEIFDFFKIASTFWGEKFKVLLLTNHSDKEVARFCEISNLETNCVITRFVPHHEVPHYMSLGNFGICPVKPVPTKAFCTPIKNGEYWAMGLPVVITKNISDDSDLISENNMGYVLKELNTVEYLNAVKKIDELLTDKGLNAKIRKFAEIYRNYNIAHTIYTSIYK